MMKQLLKWFFMLTKRLYKKASFVIILALIPLFVFMFSVAAEGEKGFLHVILVQTNPNDEISTNLIEELTSEPSVVMFSLSNSAEEATQAVKNGDTIMVLEAMKMETPVTADRDGVIASIEVAVGDVVGEGDTLAMIG